MRQGSVVSQLNGGLGGVVHNGVEIGELEVEGIGPVADLVGGRNGTNPPVPGFSFVKVRLEREGGVGNVKPSIVP